MKRFLFPLTVLCILPQLHAQSFEEVTTNIKNYGYSTVKAVDFDNDNFVDFVVCGDDLYYNTQCDIYKNDNGEFNFYQNLTYSAYLGDIIFANLSNNNTYDLLITGQNRADIKNYKTYHYIFDKNNGFEIKEIIEKGKIYGSFANGDFNNDGKIDVFLNGINNSGHDEDVAYSVDLLTFNPNGIEFNQKVGGSQNGDMIVSDFNNDGRLDLVVFGINGENETEDAYGAFFKIYLQNKQGTFDLNQDLDGMLFGSMVAADFNADGFMDIVATGIDIYESPTTMYLINDGKGQFSQNFLPTAAVNYSIVKSIDAGDLNSDGYYDIIMAGDDENGNASSTILLYNPLKQTFDKVENDFGIANFSVSTSLVLLDYDNDNQLDVLVSSQDENYESKTALYKNSEKSINQKPLPPMVLNTEVKDNYIHFNWDGASDDKTPQKALLYEISIGTEKGKADLAKYTVNTTNWMLLKDNLPEQIYWTVKTIDASKVYSVASDVAQISTLSTIDFEKDLSLKVYPNPTTNEVTIDANSKINKIELYDLTGKKVKENNTNKIYLDAFPKGIYILKIYPEKGLPIEKKIIKK